MMKNRRQFLTTSGLFAANAVLASSFGPMLGSFQANAAQTTGYRALVCVFLSGGMDGYDTLFPYDTASYNTYAGIRAPLLLTYGSARDRSNLLPITPVNAADYGGREFALPPEMPTLHNLFETGDAAIISNVGPLLEPISRPDFESGAGRTPPRLFSHNDQISTWLTMRPEGAQYGWGGRIADEALASSANVNPDFTVVTTQGTEAFLSGTVARPYQLGLNGAQELDFLRTLNGNRSTPEGERIYQAMRAHLGASGFSSPNAIDTDMANALAGSLNINERYNQARASLPPLGATFPGSSLGQQLQAVAETIAIRGNLGVSRQIFFVLADGFDTHAQQAATLPFLQSNLDSCIGAFFTAMQSLGVGNDVTLFTASDFGRTLVPNGDGTDHGWGNHQFIVGEAVNGRRIYGDVPLYDLGHNNDAGNGRLIPSLAVEQMVEPLGRWFGLNDAEINRALPNLGSFIAGAVPVV